MLILCSFMLFFSLNGGGYVWGFLFSETWLEIRFEAVFYRGGGMGGFVTFFSCRVLLTAAVWSQRMIQSVLISAIKCGSEKLRITSRVSSRLQPNWDNDSLNNLYFNIYQKIWIQEMSMQIIDNKIELNMKSATIRKKASAKIFCMAGQIWHYYCCISKQ